MRSPGSARHLGDADLMRYIDAEGEADERHRWDRHLDGCATCRDAAAALRADSETVARWLVAADFEGAATAVAPAIEPARLEPLPATDDDGARVRTAPVRVWRDAVGGSPWLKAAVIVLLLAAPVAAAPAVRDWLAERVGLNRTDAPALTSAVDAHDATAPAVIRFVPAPGSFAVVLDAGPAGGMLHVERSTGPEALLEVTGGWPGPTPVVAASSLRITNIAAGAVTYRLALPSQVESVLLDIDGRRVRLDASTLDRATTIPLGPPRDGS